MKRHGRWTYRFAGLPIGLAAGLVLAVTFPAGASHYPAPISKSLGGTGSTSSTLTADALSCSGCVDLTTEVSATLPIANGGTNATSLAQGACYSTGTALATTAGTATTVLHGNAAGNPTFAAVALAADVSGTLPVANGGTGAATLTTNNVLLGNGTSALQVVAPGTTGNVLTSNGTTWTSAAPTGGGSIGTAGQALRTILPLGLLATNATSSNQAVGQYAFDKADYTVTNLTTTFVFETVCAVDVGTATCETTLRDLTNATTVATLTTSSTNPDRKVSANLVLAAGVVVYEARFRVSAGAGVATHGSAVVRVNQTF